MSDKPVVTCPHCGVGLQFGVGALPAQSVQFRVDADGSVHVVTALSASVRIGVLPLQSLSAQEEPTQTDENRVSFAAGYSQALDDQAKGLK